MTFSTKWRKKTLFRTKHTAVAISSRRVGRIAHLHLHARGNKNAPLLTNVFSFFTNVCFPFSLGMCSSRACLDKSSVSTKEELAHHRPGVARRPLQEQRGAAVRCLQYLPRRADIIGRDVHVPRPEACRVAAVVEERGDRFRVVHPGGDGVAREIRLGRGPLRCWQKNAHPFLCVQLPSVCAEPVLANDQLSIYNTPPSAPSP